MYAKATVDGQTIAETGNFEYVEGNVYFPRESIVNRDQTLTASSHTSACPWKGKGHYYDVHVNGKTLEDAAWYYPHPLPMAKHIKDHVAFYKGKVHVEKDDGKDGEHSGLKDKLKGMLKG